MLQDEELLLTIATVILTGSLFEFLLWREASRRSVEERSSPLQSLWTFRLIFLAVLAIFVLCQWFGVTRWVFGILLLVLFVLAMTVCIGLLILSAKRSNQVVQRAMQLAKEDQVDEAVSLLESRINPEEPDVVVLTNLSQLLARRRRWQEALNHLDRGIDKWNEQGDPIKCEVVLQLVKSDVLRQKGDTKDALALANRQIEICPKFIPLHTLRAMVLRDLGRLSAAQESLSVAEELLSDREATGIVNRDDYRSYIAEVRAEIESPPQLENSVASPLPDV